MAATTIPLPNTSDTTTRGAESPMYSSMAATSKYVANLAGTTTSGVGVDSTGIHQSWQRRYVWLTSYMIQYIEQSVTVYANV
jgi:hypothetical protein